MNWFRSKRFWTSDLAQPCGGASTGFGRVIATASRKGRQRMEMIGDPQAFAIQLEWDRRPICKPWMYGMFCLHICGERLGSPWN